MEFTVIEQLMVSLAPVITAIITMIAAMMKVVKTLKQAKSEIDENIDFSDVKTELKQLISDNKELKKQNKLLLEQITRIKNYDEEV